MAVAKKNQTVLLPCKPQISGYELAVYTNPAYIVGGDYYDIINTQSGDLILMGDVSGHMITAGLVMMMAQTAIHTSLDQHQNIKPSELVAKINKTITENIKLLGGLKYMTLVALCTYHA